MQRPIKILDIIDTAASAREILLHRVEAVNRRVYRHLDERTMIQRILDVCFRLFPAPDPEHEPVPALDSPGGSRQGAVA